MGKQSIEKSEQLMEKKFERFSPVTYGDKWKCVRCASCCRSDFEKDWIDFLNNEKKLKFTGGKCPNLEFSDGQFSCSIYGNRPNACKGFPFTLRKNEIGSYVLVAHGGCKGLGQGPVIDIKEMIKFIIDLSNIEFGSKIKADL